MAREFANIQTSIWGDPDVRALPIEHQGLYLQLWTHPDLSYAGVLDWRPGRNLAPLSAGSTAESIRALIPLLEQKLFVIVDEDTEEILVRSYARHDGLMKNPSTAVSLTKAYSGVGSNMLRGVIVHELARLREEFPEWKCWGLAQVIAILKHPQIDPKSLHLGGEHAPSDAPSVAPHVAPQSTPSVAPRPTATATSTTTNASHSSRARDETSEDEPGRATRLPKSWAPTVEHIERARAAGVDVLAEAERFRLHAEAHDRRAVRWNAAFTMWLSKARRPPGSGGDPYEGMKQFGGPA